MYVHRNNDNTQPYTSVMISPSAPPINEEFFYSTSPTANVKSDHDTPSTNLTTTTPPNSTYHTGMLAYRPPNNAETVQAVREQDELPDNHPSAYHHSSFTIRSVDQYDLMLPPPYQATAPLLAAQEGSDGDNEENTTLAHSSPPLHNFVEHTHYYGVPQSMYFSPYWFLISFSFFVFGLALVITSVVVIKQCIVECTDLESDGSSINDLKAHCDPVCRRGWQLAAQDGGAAVTAVAGLATVAQLFALPMWQLHICFNSCRKR